MEKLFHLKEHGTNVKTEILAGITTFLAMAYILAVNPAILGQAHMSHQGVFLATAISAGAASIFMGLMANYPVSLAPGMGVNALFTYTIVGQMGGIITRRRISLRICIRYHLCHHYSDKHPSYDY